MIMNRRVALSQLGALAAAGCALGAGRNGATHAPQGSRPRNVLLIAVDDLRPVGEAFSAPGIHAPNIDALARTGTAFQRAYAQYAVCNPSRASLLTGLRPDSTRVFDLDTHFRANIPDVVTLAQRFALAGYTTTGIGKVYHLPFDDPASWSIPSWSPEREIEYRDPALRDALKAANPDGTDDIVIESDPVSGTVLRTRSREGRVRGPAFEIADHDSDSLPDARIAERAVRNIETLARSGAPFFLAVGFKKPHLPFVAPREFFDLYPAERIELASNAFRPLGLPEFEAHRAELSRYQGMPEDLDLTAAQRRDLVRGYSASATFMDSQIGRVMAALEQQGLRENTVVVLFGDHGYFLGENGFWAKHNNLEVATRSPLIISAPGLPVGIRTEALSELVDIAPTLLELCGLPSAPELEGTSLVSVLTENRPVKAAAFSQYRRGGAEGRSIRTDTHRYTEWRNRTSGEIVAKVLFDHREDPQENINLADSPDVKDITARLAVQLASGWQAAQHAAIRS
jgi:arylsulfatase A-like enzyme